MPDLCRAELPKAHGDRRPIGSSRIADGWPGSDTAYLFWEQPQSCVAADEFNIYKNSALIGSTSDTFYVDPGLLPEFYEYYITAVYYFGESDFSLPAYSLIVGLENADATRFQIFPNPASDLVTVKSPIKITTIRIHSNTGQLVMNVEVNALDYQIDVSKMESGIYYIRLDTNEGQILQKIECA